MSHVDRFGAKVCTTVLLGAFLTFAAGGCGGGPVVTPKNAGTVPSVPEKTKVAPEKTKVKLGIQASPAMALVMAAKEAGEFDKQGLDVELVHFTAGKFALQALLGGSLDFCVSGEVPVGLATLQGNKITVVSQVVSKTVNECRVVALKDETANGGAKAYFQAKRRKLATSMGGGPEFFTYSFLKKNGIPSGDVEILSMKPEDMPAALASKSVDAIAVFDPFVYLAEKRMGETVVTFADAEIYSELYVLAVNPKQLTAGPQTVDAVLRALIETTKLLKEHPEQGKAAVAKHTQLDAETIEGVWNNFHFEAALTPKLLEFWANQYEWARETGKTASDTKAPDFRAVVADGPLRRIAADAVTIPEKP